MGRLFKRRVLFSEKVVDDKMIPKDLSGEKGGLKFSISRSKKKELLRPLWMKNLEM